MYNNDQIQLISASGEAVGMLEQQSTIPQGNDTPHIAGDELLEAVWTVTVTMTVWSLRFRNIRTPAMTMVVPRRSHRTHARSVTRCCLV